MASLVIPACVGVVPSQRWNDVHLLRRFCRNNCLRWIGLLAYGDLLKTLQWLPEGVVAPLINGRMVVFDVVAVPSYAMLRLLPEESGLELLTKLARCRVPVLSATDDLEQAEVEWLTRGRVIGRKRAA